MSSTTYEIDGQNFSTLEELYEEFSRKVIPGAQWGHNLNAFNDVLFGGFGTPPGGFTLVWKNSDFSRERLGYPETVRKLQDRLAHCHSSAKESVQSKLKAAERGEGPTVFDWLIEIVMSHGEGAMLGDEPSEVFLVLE
jgi:RNAse (barnase) inhibitor barstar